MREESFDILPTAADAEEPAFAPGEQAIAPGETMFAPGEKAFAPGKRAFAPPPPAALAVPEFLPVPPPPAPKVLGHLQHLCGCSNRRYKFKPRRVQRIRNVESNKFSSGGSHKLSSKEWCVIL